MARDAETRLYRLGDEPRNEAYVDLLDAALGTCETALLVVRDERPGRRRPVCEALAPYLSYEGRSSFWPGTLSSDVATVLHYAVSRELVDALKRLATRLYAWDWDSELPEDLCFLREDGREWLVSVAHERDAWMWLTQHERMQLARVAPALSALLQTGH